MPNHGATFAVQVKRVDRVDQVVRERGWSLAVARELAIELGCDVSTVYRYWRRVRRWTQQTTRTGDLEAWRATQVQELSDIAREARKEKDYRGAVRAIHTQAQILGTMAPTKVEARVQHEAVVIPTVIDATTGQPRRATLEEMVLQRARAAAVEAEFSAVTQGAEAPPALTPAPPAPSPAARAKR